MKWIADTFFPHTHIKRACTKRKCTSYIHAFKFINTIYFLYDLTNMIYQTPTSINVLNKYFSTSTNSAPPVQNYVTYTKKPVLPQSTSTLNRGSGPINAKHLNWVMNPFSKITTHWGSIWISVPFFHQNWPSIAHFTAVYV